MSNKKGYILVLVLGTVAVMFFLASTLYNYTTTRTYWTINHTKSIEDVAEARMVVDTIAADIEDYLYNFRNINGKLMEDLHSQDFTTYFTRDVIEHYEQQYCDVGEECIKIQSLMKQSCVDQPEPCYEENSYSYAYEIIYDKEVVATKKFFISMIPSFLHFALGSSTDLTINGGAYIDGDIYTRNDFYLSDVSNYIKNGLYKNEKNSTATLSKTSNLYLGNRFKYCRDTSSNPCYTINNQFIKNDLNFEPSDSSQLTQIDYQNAFSLTGYPKLMDYNNEFLEVNFEKSYVYYLKDSAGKQGLDEEYTDFKQYVSNLIDGYRLDPEDTLTEVDSIADIHNTEGQSVLLSSDYQITFNEDVTFNKEHWIVIDGDLYIENYLDKEIIINANILVTGNVVITGNVAFDSTIYSLGLGLIHGANIKGVNTSQLVLLTYEDIEFSVINSYNNDFENKICRDYNSETDDCDPNYEPDLQGFFFTNKKAAFYGVASYINIEGGIYAKDSENVNRETDFITIEDTDSIGLLINSYRGRVTEQDVNNFEFAPSILHNHARVVIRHNSSIFKNLNQGLPINDQVNYAFEKTIVRK